MFFQKIAELICLFAQRFFRNHISAKLIAEEIEILKILSETAEGIIRHGDPLTFLLWNRCDDYLILIKDKVGLWISEAGFFHLICQFVGGVVGTAVCAGTKVPAISIQQYAPSLGEIHQSEENCRDGYQGTYDAVGFTEQIVLHTGQEFKALTAVLHTDFVINHKCLHCSLECHVLLL